MTRYWWVFILAAPLFAILLAGVKVYYSIQLWTYSGPEVVFEIKSGEGFSSINSRLARQNLISSSKLFYRYAQINDLTTKFKAGQFKIPPGTNMIDMFDILINGRAITTDITIPEGKNLFEIAEILGSAGVTNKDDFIKLATDPSFVRSLGIEAERIEGYLYPETYRFNPNSPADSVIKGMLTVFKNKTADLNLSENALGLSPHQVIILASVVEKETGAKEERPRIAGVFINRLKKKMRLQSDPTTIYGIWEEYNGNLKKQHLLEYTPYNTYKVNGLPKGPISNPGIESIKAVLNPEEHKYLYFVSQNDGTHIFSETYQKHNEAVKKYQVDARNRRGKSWRDLNKNQENNP
ncbi:MAG: endolytic transglycosylase MltG [Bdellovibrio sp.]